MFGGKIVKGQTVELFLASFINSQPASFQVTLLKHIHACFIHRKMQATYRSVEKITTTCMQISLLQSLHNSRSAFSLCSPGPPPSPFFFFCSGFWQWHLRFTKADLRLKAVYNTFFLLLYFPVLHPHFATTV